MLYFKYSVNRSILLKFKKSVVLKSFNLRHLQCRFSYLKDTIILLAYLFARKLKTVLCGYRISDVTVAKKPLGIWYKFPIRFRHVRIPSMSRPYLTRVNNPLGRAIRRPCPSAYLTIISQRVYRLFLYIFPLGFIRIYLRKRKTERNADNLPFSHLIAVSSVKTYRSFPYRFPIFLHIRRLYA